MVLDGCVGLWCWMAVLVYGAGWLCWFMVLYGCVGLWCWMAVLVYGAGWLSWFMVLDGCALSAVVVISAVSCLEVTAVIANHVND